MTTFRRLSDFMRVATACARELPPGGPGEDRARQVARRAYRDPDFEPNSHVRYLIETVLEGGASCPAIYTVAPDLALAALCTVRHHKGVPKALPPMFDEPWLLEVEGGDGEERLILHATSIGGVERLGQSTLYWLDYFVPPQTPQPTGVMRRVEWSPKRPTPDPERRRDYRRTALGGFIQNGLGATDLELKLASITACFVATLAAFVHKEHGDVVCVEERELPPWVDLVTAEGHLRAPALGVRARHLAVRPGSWVDTTLGPTSSWLQQEIRDRMGVVKPPKR
jgi:hypothetical protein